MPLIVSRTLGFGTAAPAVFSPNGDGRADKLAIRFRLAVPAEVKVRVLRDGRGWRHRSPGLSPPGRRDSLGRQQAHRPAAGRLVHRARRGDRSARDGEAKLPFSSDTHAPRLRFVPGHSVRLWVSEPATLVLRIAGRPSRIAVSAAGNVTIPAQPGTRVRVVAWDAAGNVSAPLRNL